MYFLLRKFRRVLEVYLVMTVVLSIAACNAPKSRMPGKAAVGTNPVSPTDVYADQVRTSSFQMPEQERLAFGLPPGFEATLFASEPDITKPINMEFDDRGRLWVTQSSEYPIAAGTGNGKDRITILEDKNGDGKADTFTHFDDNLNIPIGIMPVSDGAIAYSIPNLYYFKDTNNDGKADSKKVLLGEFGHKDTHGMVNNIMRGYDGWLHVCHGFSNTSTVSGTDGDSITMVSGNTFRVKMDGSRVEQTTFGRVNPFGYAYDERGYLYSVDCHTKPITQLIPGGDYPHFGKKAPAGIGFAPEMMTYDLGSTALAGLVYYTGTQFPQQYQNSFYTGDVVTCRIDRNTITYVGSTPVSHKEEPFLVSNDPWFRPVDVKLGPDGSLYIADFYNRIIGHYEVALNHPGRDRLSGRIWKITYKGDRAHKDMPVKDWSVATIDELIEGLGHPQLNTRLKVADRLVDTWGSKAAERIRATLEDKQTDRMTYVHGLWVLHRLNALDDVILNGALGHSNSEIRIHALRIVKERPALSEGHWQRTRDALESKDPFIQRAAAEILTKFPRAENLKYLIALYESANPDDSHLKYTAILAVRNNLRNNGVMWKVPSMDWTDIELRVLAKTMLDVPSSQAASFVLDYVILHEVASKDLIKCMEYIGRFAAAYQVERAIKLITSRFAGDQETQLALYRTIQTGIKQSGAWPGQQMRQWGSDLASYFLADVSEEQEIWQSRPLDKMVREPGPWYVSDSFLADIMPAFRIVLSEKNGYSARAALYSVPFKLPSSLKMNVFDNDVHNTAAKIGISNNVIRIRLAAGGKVIGIYRVDQKELSRDGDLIRNTTFDLSAYEGQKGYIEAVDSSLIGSVGIGKFEPAVVEIPANGPSLMVDQRTLAAEIAGEYKIETLVPVLRKLVASNWLDHKVRNAAAGALMNLDPEGNASLLADVFRDPSQLPVLREKLAVLIGQASSPSVYEVLKRQLAGGARSLQIVIATVLSNTSEGISHLLHAFTDEEVNPDIVTEVAVKERFAANATVAQQQRMDKLLASGANEREERQKLIDSRIAGYKRTGNATDGGMRVFRENCGSCHQIKGAGGLVGPQLDGIGNWGSKALTQKILDPNRNITEAFRTYNITLKNDKTLTGLYRRTEGQTMIFADFSGQEFSVSVTDMKEYKASRYTLMPDQFRNVIPEKDFYALMEYLLSVK